MKKKVRVIMLPTEDKTHIFKHGNSLKYLDILNGNNPYENNGNQHLYLTSDNEIKEGDFAYNKNTNSIYKVGKFTSIAGHEGHSVKPLKSDIKEGEFYTYIGQHYSQYSKKIIATSDIKLTIAVEKSGENSWHNPIPQIPQSFIEEYVKQGGIDKVELEHEVIKENVMGSDLIYETHPLIITPNNEVIVNVHES